MLRWAEQFGPERRWAVEDCRHLSRRLERDLLAAGEAIVRVPPKMMANTRTCACTYGKSDPIDALAEPGSRPCCRNQTCQQRVDGPAREVRLLVDHRDNLVSERTRQTCRLRWHLHGLHPTWDPPSQTLNRDKRIDEVIARLADFEGLVVRVGLLEQALAIRDLIRRVNILEREIKQLVTKLAPTLLAMPGCGVLSAAKIVGETRGHHPVQEQGCVRAAQRDRAVAGVVRQP